MSASASRGLLMMSTRQIQASWDLLRGTWRDQKAADFEATYLTEISDTLNSTVRALEDLEQILQKIHADCE